ncbi:MAG: MBL fold metallo-hydrolase, partial [bacterium]|nr:MBL fold metallo-hydrolase [bacterium]
PVKIIEEKAEIIQKAISLNWVLFFEHDPYHIAARIRSGAKSVEISEFVKL